MATPVAARRSFDPWLMLWVFVDSGALYTCITILALSLSFPISTASYVLTFTLGQISVRSVYHCEIALIDAYAGFRATHHYAT